MRALAAAALSARRRRHAPSKGDGWLAQDAKDKAITLQIDTVDFPFRLDQ
jgi:hypothetical protein